MRWMRLRSRVVAVPALACLLAVASGNDRASAVEVVAPVEAPHPTGWRRRLAPVECAKPLPPLSLLVERLSSPKFVERVQASRDLVRMGAPAVDRLVEVAMSDRPEASLRAVATLEDIWLKSLDGDDSAVAFAAFNALDTLSKSENPSLQARIDATLAAYESLVVKYSLNEVARLGGVVKYEEGQMIYNENDGTSRQPVQLVVLDKRWQGGEEGLRHVERLRPRSLYLSGNVPLPAGAPERFEVATGIRIERRGKSYLGIRNNSQILLPPGQGQGIVGVQVESVEPGKPAEKGGIKPGDVIVEFAGGKIDAFPDLVKQIGETEPGQTVKVKVIRLDQSVDLDVTMEAWSN